MPILNADDLDSLADDPDLAKYDKEPMQEVYREFRDDEDIPVHTGFYIKDIADLETGPWDRTGQRGAFINLYGMEGLVDLQVHDLTPAGRTDPQRHFYQEIVYVLEGDGLTRIGSGADETTFEWSTNSMFVLPKNVEYEHVNLSEDSRARLVSHTDLPLVLSLVGEEEFIFECDYDFLSGDSAAETYESGEMGRILAHREPFGQSEGLLAWQANFIPDVYQFEEIQKDDWERFGEMDIVRLGFPALNLDFSAHLGNIPVGTYKNAHRHSAGALIFVTAGEGYGLMYRPETDKKVKMEWQPGSVYCPPAGWFHHHFNVGAEPAEQMAIHTPTLGTLGNNSVFDPHHEDNVIEYDEEDPEIREHFEAELAARGVESRMGGGDD